ncbi:hypothetical protein ABEB36_014330 [Hypothenemus hampei]|uniref:aspartate transaminase n=1 Tax=Hypothenemus hampei TaxID=57062 RepID=A0ABD1E4E1_HYPHA
MSLKLVNDAEEHETFSWFYNVKQLPEVESLSLTRQFKEDDSENKLNFAFSCCHDEEGKPWVLPVVRIAEKVLANTTSLSKEYLHPLGYETFNNCAIQMLLGEESPSLIENRAFAVQTISATGGIRLAAEFLVDCLGLTTLYTTEETAKSVQLTFLKAGFLEYKEIRYLNPYTLSLDFDGLIKDLSEAKKYSVIFLQVSSHNPTGCDPNLQQWEEIAEIISNGKLFPIFFFAFQGFVSGDVNLDVAPIRIFEQMKIEFFCVQSFAFAFALYKERAGCLCVTVNNAKQVNPIKSQMLCLANSMYASPPSHGARIVAFILGDRMLSESWRCSIRNIAERLKQMRSYLREELERLGALGTWSHITNQQGIYCMLGLNEIQVEHLKKHYHIYLLSNGRMNVSGLNMDNIQYVAKAIYDTLTVICPNFLVTNNVNI